MDFKQSIISLLTTYITLVALFVISRIYWFFSFIKPDFFEENSLWETFYVFIMSLRLDSSASVLLILIPLIGTFFFPFIKFFQTWWKKIIINYIIMISILVNIMKLIPLALRLAHECLRKQNILLIHLVIY